MAVAERVPAEAEEEEEAVPARAWPAFWASAVAAVAEVAVAVAAVSE